MKKYIKPALDCNELAMANLMQASTPTAPKLDTNNPVVTDPTKASSDAKHTVVVPASTGHFDF